MKRSRSFPAALVSYVAKTGFVTRETWEKFFFTGGRRRWRYQAWNDLSRRGYFQSYPCRRLSGVYVLNRTNRETASFVGPHVARPPAVSQLDHDEALNHGLLQAQRQGVVVHWTTEPELKVLGGGSHRIESRSGLTKYPDALVQLAGRDGDSPLAIELEQTLKSRDRYVQILGAYSAMNGISGVLFICKSAAIERAIQGTAERLYFPVDEIRLGFMSLEEWQKSPTAIALH